MTHNHPPGFNFNVFTTYEPIKSNLGSWLDVDGPAWSMLTFFEHNQLQVPTARSQAYVLLS